MHIEFKNENEFTATVLVSRTVTQFLWSVPQLAPWCARYLLWREQKNACAALVRIVKTGVFLQLFGCTDDVSAAGVCIRLPERVHEPHFPCRRHGNVSSRRVNGRELTFQSFSVSCSRQREPTGTLVLCCIWFWRTTRSRLSQNYNCTRMPSSMYLSWFSVLHTWCLVWTPCCSLTG